MTMPDKVQFLCSCPDYLNGTNGKLTKKKTNCKQCKGIKLPFAPIGGTVRMFSTPYVFDPVVTKRRNCVGTVRLPSSSSSLPPSAIAHRRPTILCGDHDPYDFLRQSRLMYSTGNDQNRKSMPEVSNDASRVFRNGIGSDGGGATSANNAIIRSHRNFLPNATVGRASASDMLGAMNRSILHTNINPYDLISFPMHNNEFSPSNTNLYDLVMPRKLSGTQVIPLSVDLPTTSTRKMPIVNALMSTNQRTPSTISSRTSSRTTTANSSDSSNSVTHASPSKYKSILKQPPLLGTNASRIGDSSNVLHEFDNKLFERRPLSMPTSNEMRNSQLNRIPVPVRSVSISNGGAKPSPVPMSTYDVQTVGRNKKVQFSESSNSNEKSIGSDADDSEIERNRHAKCLPAQSDAQSKATKDGEHRNSVFLSIF